MGARLAYLALETPRPGQASYTHIHEMIAELRELGWSVDLFATVVGGASSRSGMIRRLSGYLGTQLRLALRLRRYDGVYVRAHFMAAPVAILASWMKKPVYQELNGRPDEVVVTYPGLARLMPMIAWLYRLQMRRASQILPVTDGLARWATAVGGHMRVTVVPNGANTRLFRPEGPTAPVGFRYVVFVGGLVAWHGIGTMLAATRDAVWPEDVRLIVIGDGPERQRLAEGPEGRVIWLGRLPYEDVPSYLRGAIAALCLIEDAGGRAATGVAPLKLYEAMACGTPVIVSALPFQEELVRGIDAGDVVPMADPGALAEAVRLLCADAQARDAKGRNGARYVQLNASWTRRAEQVSVAMGRGSTPGA